MNLPHSHPLCWRQVSGEDPDQYKRYVRGQIKQLTEQENDPLVGDWIVVYVWHSGIDPNSKGARKVSNCDSNVPAVQWISPKSTLRMWPRCGSRWVMMLNGLYGHWHVQTSGGCQCPTWSALSCLAYQLQQCWTRSSCAVPGNVLRTLNSCKPLSQPTP